MLPKTMEEVWKDITTLPQHHPTSGSVIFQDFFSKDPLPIAASSPPPPPPAPPTLLTLSSSVPQSHPPMIPHHVSSLSNVPFYSLAPDDINDAGAGKKRFPDFERNSGDRRHKRMIKNRESAARSRARKQAYTNELELEVAHLVKENARLKEQQKQMCIEAAAAAQHQKKSLQRTSTAPF